MQLHGDMTSITECNASSPSSFPDVRPIGPHRKLVSDLPCAGDDLEQHARKVMNMIENELACKYHVDHTVDAKRFCTYLNRSNGLNLKKDSKTMSDHEGKMSAHRSMKLTHQRRKAGLATYIRGQHNKLDIAVDRAVSSVNMHLADRLFIGSSASSASALLEWHNDALSGNGVRISELRRFHADYSVACEDLAATLAN